MSELGLQTVAARYEEKFLIRGLAIAPELTNATNEFEFHAHRARVILPGMPDPASPPWDDRAESSVFSRSAATNEILSVFVSVLKISFIDLSVTIPKEAANHSGMNVSLYKESELEQLDIFSDYMCNLSQRLIDYWIRVVRWKMNYAFVMINDNPSFDRSSSGQLVNSTTGHRFYIPPSQSIITASPVRVLTSAAWKAVDIALSSGDESPVWYDYLATAQIRAEADDFNAAVLDLAIAAESCIRRHLSKNIPSGSPPGFADILSRITMSDLISRWLRLGLPKKQDFHNFVNLSSLFQERNAIMHKGQGTHNFDRNKIEDIIKTVKSLISILS